MPAPWSSIGEPQSARASAPPAMVTRTPCAWRPAHARGACKRDNGHAGQDTLGEERHSSLARQRQKELVCLASGVCHFHADGEGDGGEMRLGTGQRRECVRDDGGRRTSSASTATFEASSACVGAATVPAGPGRRSRMPPGHAVKRASARSTPCSETLPIGAPGAPTSRTPASATARMSWSVTSLSSPSALWPTVRGRRVIAAASPPPHQVALSWRAVSVTFRNARRCIVPASRSCTPKARCDGSICKASGAGV